MKMEFDRALAIAKSEIEKLEKLNGVKLALVSNDSRELESGWIFFYNSKEFIDSRNPISALAGNGPIYVKLDGSVKLLPTHSLWEDEIEDS